MPSEFFRFAFQSTVKAVLLTVLTLVTLRRACVTAHLGQHLIR